MQEALRVFLTTFTDETIIISLMVLIVIFSILMVYWLYNRRKYRELTHQIPASVVKSYLDSIIQNSTSLKSSLFRGGGLEVGDGIPSVVPSRDFPSSGVQMGGASPEEISQKNAEIASLNARLSDKEKIVLELEKKLQNMRAQLEASGDDATLELQKQLDAAHARIAELEALLAQQPSGGGDPEIQSKLDEVTQERDELKERLAEYEIIEDDIANLKKYKQENEQLKKSLAAYEGGGAPAAAAIEDIEPAAVEPEPIEDIEPAAVEPAPEEDDLEAQMAAAIEESAPEPAPEEDDLEAQIAAAIQEAPEEEPEAPAAPPVDEAPLPDEGDAEQKSAEELLSEFEKMLG